MMKQKILLLASCIMAAMSSMAATRAAVVLLHNGTATTFDSNQLPDAMKAAAHGDTLYLSEGTFGVDTLLVDKVVTMIGAGQLTKVRGNIHVSIADNPHASNYFFDGMWITGDVKIAKEMRGLKIRKCKIEGTLWAAEDLKDLQADRCYITTFLPSKQVKNASFVNCYIVNIGTSSTPDAYWAVGSTTSKGNDLIFLNCSIYSIIGCPTSYSSDRTISLQDAGFINCHIKYIFLSYSSGNSCSFTNTLLSGDTSFLTGDIVQNCYIVNNANDGAFWNSMYNDPEKLVAAGYLGLDGTAVGYLGGSTPYSLTPVGINVSESLLTVDTESKTLNVTLKVSAVK